MKLDLKLMVKSLKVKDQSSDIMICMQNAEDTNVYDILRENVKIRSSLFVIFFLIYSALER